MDLTKFATDPVKEAGTWVSYDATSRFLIGAMNNDAFTNRVRELRDPILKSLPRGQQIDPVTADAIMVQAMSELTLLGWEGVQINGQELPYSREAAKAALGEPRLRAFREWVYDQATKLDNFRLDNFEDLMGNLLRSSATTVQ